MAARRSARRDSPLHRDESQRPLGTWHHLVTRVVANGSSSTVEVWFDGKLLYSSKVVATRFTAVTKMQLGAEHRRQAGDSFIDDVVIKARKA